MINQSISSDLTPSNKYSRKPINYSIIEEVKEKINRLSLPRNYSVLPILIYVSGVSESILDADYFYSVIDFSDFL